MPQLAGLCALGMLIATACSPGLPSLAPTGVAPTAPEVHAIPTIPMFPTSPPTREPTPAPTTDISQFRVCKPENLLECAIPAEALCDGSYMNWLHTLSKPFDPAGIKVVPLVWDQSLNLIFYSQIGLQEPWMQYQGPNFSERGTEPFRRDVTAAYAEWTDDLGELHRYAVLPVEYYDKTRSNRNPWVITVENLHWATAGNVDDIARSQMRYWRTMRVTPIKTDFFLPHEDHLVIDPLVRRTFANYSDMTERFRRFVAGDLSALSEQGIVLSTFSQSNSNHMFE